jgi:hypothetical protein
MNRLLTFALFCFLIGSQVPAQAQVTRVPGGRWYVGSRAAYGGYGGYGYASTPGQGYMQGMSQIISAEGGATLNRSEAAINMQTARSSYIDNNEKWLNQIHQQRRYEQQNQAEKVAQAREKNEKYLANQKSGQPARLTPSQLDPATGNITWPEALRGPSYAGDRKKIEELIQLRTFTSTTDDIGSQINTAARQMQADLKDGIRDLPANQYIDARKFLDSLAFEGRSPRTIETASAMPQQ